jgi:protocatechuate 3,4-dioxygenase beta subunit
MRKLSAPPRAALFALAAFLAAIPASLAGAQALRPTPADALGPFYKPGAPLRASVGRGYLLSGRVLSSRDGSPLPGAVLELWLAGPDGEYADAWRATLQADEAGRYRFSSHLPVPYAGRPPHIHLRVSAPGHRTLVTQHYPRAGDREAVSDLVLAAAGAQ